MSESHEKLPKLFWIQLALAGIIGVLYLTTPASKSHGTDSAASDSTVKAAAETLKPVGAVATKDTAAATSGKARSGEEVYRESCGACHDSGVANAPKLDDKAAWEPRLANGLDGLVNTAINGKGAMPARGGNPAITDEEIKAAVLYMTSKAGIDLSTAPKASEPVAMEEKKAEAPASTTSTEEAPAAPSAPAAPAAPAVTAAAATTTMAVSPPAMVDLSAGEKVYKDACFACHDAGVAGSPKIGDIPAWTARIAAGSESMYNAAINGIGVMPPKGGNMGLSDDQVKAAVDYMAAKSR